jgi:hypothetical protein
MPCHSRIDAVPLLLTHFTSVPHMNSKWCTLQGLAPIVEEKGMWELKPVTGEGDPGDLNLERDACI